MQGVVGVPRQDARVLLLGSLLALSMQAQPFLLATTRGFTAVINLSDPRRVVDRLPGGTVVAVAPNGHRVYIGGEGSITVFETGTSQQIPWPGLTPQGMAVSPDSRRLYVAAARQITVFDAETLRPLNNIAIGPGLGRLALSPDGRRLYSTIGEAVAVDTATNRVVTTFDDPNAVGVAVSPDGARLFVGNTFDTAGICEDPDAPLAQVFNARTGELIRSLRLGGSACLYSAALSPDGRTLYLGDLFGGKVRVIDTDSYATRPSVEVPGFVQDVAVSWDGSLLFAALNTGVAVIDARSGRVSETIALGALVTKLAVNPLAPELTPESVRNAVTLGGSLSPGAIASIWGTDLSHGSSVADAVPLPVSMLETSVLVNNVRAPLYFVSSTQINFQLPYEIAPGEAEVRVERNSWRNAATFRVAVSEFSPSIFTLNQQGSGPGWIAHADRFTLVSESAPARPGEYVVVLAAGLGRLEQDLPSGTPAADHCEHWCNPR